MTTAQAKQHIVKGRRWELWALHDFLTFLLYDDDTVAVDVVMDEVDDGEDDDDDDDEDHNADIVVVFGSLLMCDSACF